ncbi:LPS assembly lipoprotein LptE [Pyxidicoccus xibeiensis]|uniref:LPS assembly lipoprotein LptE n=1 Tax=Pyxidicoccus xibeiensis TaxID=2906759 RepID=UPI0020A70A0D|nr:LptE family protein [Pyxidicoccus xibeiensis]MCP3144778.1 LPS assembly lipoprotein LptE [Pyxidicoccus xibeiensis]
MSRPFGPESRRLWSGWVLGAWGACVAAGAGCGYRFVPKDAGLPEGINSVCAPIFGNETAEPTLETLFTRFLRQELTRVGRLSGTGACDARLEGTVLWIGNSPTIAGNYFRIAAQARLRLVKDGQILRETVVGGSEDYLLGSGDILEAEANKQAALDRLAELLMRDGYDRLASTW